MTQKISATIVADSVGPRGDRITTFLLVFPRFILAELNTHRMFSRNSASSRAIPFKKMIEAVTNDPFIPIAWQKDHSGMQGNEYITDPNKIEEYESIWLYARDKAIESAKALNSSKGNDIPVTKQLCNRLLEPFMWHTCLVTSTEWENFFALRCPQYQIENVPTVKLDGTDANVPITLIGKSKKQLIKEISPIENILYDDLKTILGNYDDLDWLKINRGQAEIHMMILAEAMWDAYNESTPQKLKAGEWHIPFGDKIQLTYTDYNSEGIINQEGITKTIKIATARCARTSYTTIGDEKEISYERLIQIHDNMYNQNPFHASPFEHIAQVMGETEGEENYYRNFYKGDMAEISYSTDTKIQAEKNKRYGWCDNFKGFISYRHMVEKERRNK